MLYEWLAYDRERVYLISISRFSENGFFLNENSKFPVSRRGLFKTQLSAQKQSFAWSV